MSDEQSGFSGSQGPSSVGGGAPPASDAAPGLENGEESPSRGSGGSTKSLSELDKSATSPSRPSEFGDKLDENSPREGAVRVDKGNQDSPSASNFAAPPAAVLDYHGYEPDESGAVSSLGEVPHPESEERTESAPFEWSRENWTQSASREDSSQTLAGDGITDSDYSTEFGDTAMNYSTDEGTIELNPPTDSHLSLKEEQTSEDADESGSRFGESDPSILDYSRIESMSAQICDLEFHKEVGAPTALTTSKEYVFVGTSRGCVVIFSMAGELKGVLSPAEPLHQGQACHMSATPDSKWLAVGHYSKYITIWDVAANACFKTIQIPESVASSQEFRSPVVSIDFLNKTKLLAGLSDGSVISYAFHRMFFVYKVEEQILTGDSLGEPVLSVKPLRPSREQHPIDQYGLVACATTRRMLILSVSRSISVLLDIKRPETVSTNSNACVSWREMEEGGFPPTSPILAVGWGNLVCIIRISENPSYLAISTDVNALKHALVATCRMRSEVIGLQWLGQDTLVFVCASGEIGVFDFLTKKKVETKDTQIDVSLQTNLQPPVCRQFMCGSQGCAYLLDRRGVYSFRVLSWIERVNNMAKKSKLGAIDLALAFYNGEGLAVREFPMSRSKAKHLIVHEVKRILYDYVLSNLPPEFQDGTMHHYETVATTAINYCLMIKCSNFLFDKVLPLFRSGGKLNLFLEKLEPFLLNREISDLPEEVLCSLLEQYTCTSEPSRGIEFIVSKVDVSRLDFHRVTKTCVERCLDKFLFSLYLRVLGDCVTPIELLMDSLRGEVHDFGELETFRSERRWRQVGNGVMSFFKSVISGKLYADEAKMSASDVVRIVRTIAKYLLSEKSVEEKGWSRFQISVLFYADIEQFLACLATAFDKVLDLNVERQFLLVLIELAGEQPFFSAEYYKNGPSGGSPFSDNEVTSFFEFLSVYFNLGVVQLSSEVITRILDYAMLSKDVATHARREAIVMNIVEACSADLLDCDALLLSADSAHFYKACEFFCRQKRDFASVVAYRFKDPGSDKSGLFKLIPDFLLDETRHWNVHRVEKEKIVKMTLEHLKELLDADFSKTSNLVVEILLTDFDQNATLKALEPYPKLQYNYLSALLDKARCSKSVCSLDACHGAKAAIKGRVPFSKSFGNRLFELVCTLVPGEAIEWLEANSLYYDPDVAASMSRRHGLTSAYCMLLEKTEKFEQILNFFLSEIWKSLEFYVDALKQAQATNEIDGAKRLTESVNMLISLYQRNQKKFNPDETRDVWSQTLHVLLGPLIQVETLLAFGQSNGRSPTECRTIDLGGLEKDQLEALRDVLEMLLFTFLNRVAACIKAQDVLQEIIRQYSFAPFSCLRNTLIYFLDYYKYQKCSMDIVTHILDREAHDIFEQLVLKKKEGCIQNLGLDTGAMGEDAPEISGSTLKKFSSL
ncbi:uncharacterized protein LOC126311215 isoform X2 [Schistocerca gregaria]|uniref:uncharacterized protein LOC126311215 isoform X2 n=1 Tax=Schistocerca gregaria TaxID=7010 RepID=UPI00211E1622|nr:uncharacterized protein LOC126311215 isoform X2 [Schistocerca gregaria]